MKDDISELWDLVVAYVRQETVEPLKGLGRYVLFGIAGSVALVGGLALLVLGVLRVVQQETGSTFRGHLSWLPYCIATGATFLVAGASGAGIARARGEESKKREGESR